MLQWRNPEGWNERENLKNIGRSLNEQYQVFPIDWVVDQLPLRMPHHLCWSLQLDDNKSSDNASNQQIETEVVLVYSLGLGTYWTKITNALPNADHYS